MAALELVLGVARSVVRVWVQPRGRPWARAPAPAVGCDWHPIRTRVTTSQFESRTPSVVPVGIQIPLEPSPTSTRNSLVEPGSRSCSRLSSSRKYQKKAQQITGCGRPQQGPTLATTLACLGGLIALVVLAFSSRNQTHARSSRRTLHHQGDAIDTAFTQGVHDADHIFIGDFSLATDDERQFGF